MNDLSVHSRHIDQVSYKDLGLLSNTSITSDNDNDNSVLDSVSTSEKNPIRLQLKPPRNYRNPERHSS